MRKLLPVFACLLLHSAIAFAQTATEAPCGFDHIYHALLQSNAEYLRRTATYERAILENAVFQPRIDLLTIPVVVHIMHLPGDTTPGSGSNISNAQVQTGLAHLTDAFQHVNAYAGGPYYTNSGINSVDTEIEFCLATTDSLGNPTSGIVRFPSEYSNLAAYQFMPEGYTQEYALKLLSHWNCTQYLNIWVVNDICQYAGPPLTGCGLVGLSSFPPSHGYVEDGIVVEAAFFGTSTNNSKTLVHEAGHYLGLYHTFQGGCSETNCQLHGDRICDTPPDNSTSAATPGQPMNSCSNDSTVTNSPFIFNAQDIYENYMDYGNIATWNTFTPDQKTKMRSSLLTTRASLLASGGCLLASSLLPVEWKSFAGIATGQGILLTWETASERNAAAFFVERSANGRLFSPIAEVAAKGIGGGYSALNELPMPGVNYYRLRQRDHDGSDHFSKTIAVQWAAQNEVEIFPNPADAPYLQIKITAAEECPAILKILDARGSLLREEPVWIMAGSNSFRLPITDLPAGIYFLKTDATNFRQVQRFIKSGLR